jgi:carbamoyl-phosphate synthase small subunit
MKAKLVLEDGSVFDGISIGAAGEKIGEVIFNTAVVGYQEILTDPANAGKIVVLTYPLIGNYGVAKKFNESKRSWVAGLVIKEQSKIRSNWQAEDSFGSFLKKEKLAAISEVDTRTLAVNIRDKGQMLGIISTKQTSKDKLLKKVKDHKKNARNDHIRNISVKTITRIKGSPSGSKVAILDLGVLNSSLEQLKQLRCSVTLLPYNTNPEEILKLNPDGLIVSSGPEEDRVIPQIAVTINRLLGKIPVLGISAGHEVIGLALGGRIKKMKLGHHGVNYPVRPASSYKGEITVQNHSFVVDEGSLRRRRDVEITLRNVNDNTIEEMESKSLRFISTQYYPVSPGDGKANEVFKRFLNMTKKRERNSICQSVKI